LTLGDPTQDSPPVWPNRSLFPARGLTAEEQTLEPRLGWVRASDGYRLARVAWLPPAGRATRAIAVVLHGVQSHAGWYHGLGRRLAVSGILAFFYDRRGSGANALDRGHARSSSQLVDDLKRAIDEARALAQTEGGASKRLPLVVAGISWGGKVAVAGAARFPNDVDGLALIGPGLMPRVGVSLGERLKVASAVLTGRGARVRLPIPLADPSLFTDDPEAQTFIAQDPLSLRDATARLLATSFFLDRAVARAPGRVTCPTLLLLAGQDRIINNGHTRQYVERLASPRKTVIEYPEAHHTMEFEADPSLYVRDLVGWIDADIIPSEAGQRT
jgi:alpha-beta hydrolase superfamily lysophospholipase